MIRSRVAAAGAAASRHRLHGRPRGVGRTRPETGRQLHENILHRRRADQGLACSRRQRSRRLGPGSDPGRTAGAGADAGGGEAAGHPGLRHLDRRRRLLLPDSRGEYRGLDNDLCRATAAAVLGDAGKVRWVPLTSTARLPALQSGQVDVLIRTATWTQVRDTANGLNFTAVSFYDGQGFLLRESLGLKPATELQGASICVIAGSTNELNLAGLGADQQDGLPPGGVRAERRGAAQLPGRPVRRLFDRCQPARRAAVQLPRTRRST